MLVSTVSCGTKPYFSTDVSRPCLITCVFLQLRLKASPKCSTIVEKSSTRRCKSFCVTGDGLQHQHVGAL